MFRTFAAAGLATVYLAPLVFSQTPAKIDFARDVQPIFRQNCIGCHGPAKQNNGLRLDRRSSVMKPGSRRVMPRSIENSFLYYRLTGNEFGLQMPPTGPLKPEQIQVIKAWVEQGAEWPDALANEIELPPLDNKAVALVTTLRTDGQAFLKSVTADPKLLNARGPEGSTPFMYAVLYTGAPTLERLLKLGADPNKRNDDAATALMWAALDLEKTKVLLAHGADVNAKSADSRTPLMVASSRPGNSATVKLLLEHGANPNPTSNPSAESSPLLEASLAGDPGSIAALLEKGAEPKEAGAAFANAAGADCMKCVDLLLTRKWEPMQYTIGLQNAIVLRNPVFTKLMLDRGADVNAADPTGRTALMYAAVSDLLPVEQIKMLIERKVDLNAKSAHKQSGDSGMTALDIAKLHGHTAVVEVLEKAGATGAAPAPSEPAPTRQSNTIDAAIQAGLALMQRTDANFMPKTGCFSCHNNSLAALTVATARKAGYRVDEKTAAQQLGANAGALSGARDLLHQGTFAVGLNENPVILSYALLGLEAEGYNPGLTTDAAAMFIQTHQMADGHLAAGPESRPPLCADDLDQTVLSLRALQLYAPTVDKAAFAKSIHLAATWIGEYRPQTNYDLAWRLQGLVWGGKSKDVILKARNDLLAAQRADGGWSDLPSMESSAYTTGLAMIALHNSGLAASDPAYRRGVKSLLSTQLEEGSWHVRTRAAGFQPYFDNGFPHGVDQWISAAGTSLATMALTYAAPPPTVRTVAGGAPGEPQR
jgi:ankyrin repeat protein